MDRRWKNGWALITSYDASDTLRQYNDGWKESPHRRQWRPGSLPLRYCGHCGTLLRAAFKSPPITSDSWNTWRKLQSLCCISRWKESILTTPLQSLCHHGEGPEGRESYPSGESKSQWAPTHFFFHCPINRADNDGKTLFSPGPRYWTHPWLDTLAAPCYQTLTNEFFRRTPPIIVKSDGLILTAEERRIT